jgi:hypothetical protein
VEIQRHGNEDFYQIQAITILKKNCVWLNAKRGKKPFDSLNIGVSILFYSQKSMETDYKKDPNL